ncbi:unnamed protein product, partial [Timema podura]|nr:unnamed protein product [Timema podura]
LGSGLSPEDHGSFQISQFQTLFQRGVAQWSRDRSPVPPECICEVVGLECGPLNLECFGKLYNRPIDLDEDYSKDEGIGNTFEEGESCKKLPSSLKKTINEVFMDSKCDKLVEVLVDLISNSDNLEWKNKQKRNTQVRTV